MLKIAVAGEPPFKGKAQRFRADFGLGRQGRIIGLGLIDQFFVIAEIHVAQFGVPVEAHGFHDECVELPDQKIGQVKGCDFGFGVLAKRSLPSKKL